MGECPVYRAARNAALPKFYGKTFTARAKSDVPEVNRDAPAAGRKAPRGEVRKQCVVRVRLGNARVVQRGAAPGLPLFLVLLVIVVVSTLGVVRGPRMGDMLRALADGYLKEDKR